MATTLLIGGSVQPAAGEDPPPTGGDLLDPGGDHQGDDPARVEAFAEVEAAAGDGTVRALVALDVPSLLPGVPAAIDQSVAIDEAADAVEAALDDDDSEVVRRYATLPYVSVEISAAGAEQLSEIPEAASISELDTVARPLLSNSLPAIEAPDAWNLGAEGTDQLVAVIDTGLDTSTTAAHPSLAARVAYEACFSQSQCPGATMSATGAESSAPCDDHTTCGHGTGVTAIAAAVAPEADVLSIRAATRYYCSGWSCLFVPNGAAFHWDDVLASLDHVATFATENPTAPPIAAVNMSLGALIAAEELDDPDACDSHPEEPLIGAVKHAVDVLTAQGIAVVVASGNDGVSDQVSFPACVTGAIAVGATDVHNEEVTAYSNSSPKVDMLAPGGDGAGCASPDGLVVPWDDGTLTTCSGAGTSFAAPHVAGAWAVLRELTDDAGVPAAAAVPAIRQLLTTTGTPITDPRNSVTRPTLMLAPAVEAVDTLPDPSDFEDIGGYQPVPATTVVDTDNGIGTCNGSPCTQLTTAVQAQVTGVGPIPATGVTAVLVRLGAVNPASAGLVFVNPDSGTGGAEGVLLLDAGRDDSVTVLARVQDESTITLSPFLSAVDVVVEVIGFFGNDPLEADLAYQPVDLDVLADTGAGNGGCLPSPCARLAADDPVTVEVPLDTGIEGAVLNLTAFAASGSGTLEVSDANGLVARFAVDDEERDVADIVTVVGDITVESTVAVEVRVVQVGILGEDGGRLVTVEPSLAMSTEGIGVCDPGPCGPFEPDVETRVAIPGIAGLDEECISAAVLLVVASSPDGGWLAIGTDGDGTQATVHSHDGQARAQLVYANLDEDGSIDVTNINSSEDMEAMILVTGWLACPEAQWVNVFD